MNHVITMCFAPARILEQGLNNYYKFHDPALPIKHWVVDQHYPLRREENLTEIIRICSTKNISILDPGQDLGLHRGLNWAMDQIPMVANDVLIGYDPDSNPCVPGFDSALVETISAGFRIAALCTQVNYDEFRERGYSEEIHAGRRIIIPKRDCCFSITSWDVNFLRRIGGFHEENSHYGGMECWAGSKLRELGWRIGYLADFQESNELNHLADPEYKAWKWEHAHTKKFKGAFADFLKAGCPRS